MFGKMFGNDYNDLKRKKSRVGNIVELKLHFYHKALISINPKDIAKTIIATTAK